MTSSHWFSTKVRLVLLLEEQGATRYMDSVFTFRATDFQGAFERALELGRGQEQTYANAEGRRVAWRLVRVVSLDQIASESLDGAEVYSEPVPLPEGEVIPFAAEFEPEKSAPTQTV